MDSTFTKFKYLSISWKNSVGISSLVCLGWCLFHNVSFPQMFDNSVISVLVRDEDPGLSFTVEAGVHFLNSSRKCSHDSESQFWLWKLKFSCFGEKGLRSSHQSLVVSASLFSKHGECLSPSDYHLRPCLFPATVYGSILNENLHVGELFSWL